MLSIYYSISSASSSSFPSSLGSGQLPLPPSFLLLGLMMALPPGYESQYSQDTSDLFPLTPHIPSHLDKYPVQTSAGTPWAALLLGLQARKLGTLKGVR